MSIKRPNYATRLGTPARSSPPTLPEAQAHWTLRTRLHIANRVRELAMVNLAIDSKLRSCDLVALKVSDVFSGGSVSVRSVVVQHKTAQ